MPKNEELTTSEKNALLAYKKHLERFGAPPSLRKLGEALGIFPTAARNALVRLKRKGYLVEVEEVAKITVTRLSAKAKKVG